jgi:NADH dehydrogenase FAD-containing subunit
VNATGLRPSPIVREIGLPVDYEGALLVDHSLRSIADPRVHGGGDCIALRDEKLARIGVYAIREAPQSPGGPRKR